MINDMKWTPMFEYYVFRCDSKNRYKKNMCSKEIESHAQSMLIGLDSIVDIIGGGTSMTI